MADYTKNKIKTSTHIVIFTGGQFPDPADTIDYWTQYNMPDFVIAADSGLETAERFNTYFKNNSVFLPKIILGDMDSLKNSSTELNKYPKESIIRHNPYKNFTDTELALEYAYKTIQSKNNKHITLVGGDGGRLDHLLGIFNLFNTELAPNTWLCRTQSLWNANANKEFSISNLNLLDMISISRPANFPTGGCIESDGLEWEYQSFRKEGMPSISNRISEKNFNSHKDVKIQIKEGSFVLILPLKAFVKIKPQEKEYPPVSKTKQVQ